MPERGSSASSTAPITSQCWSRASTPNCCAKRASSREGGRKGLWAERLHSIRAFKRHLHANGTRFVKIYLHLSKDEQLRRLLQRLDDPDKTWKASPADAEERGYWRDYIRAYEHALTKTSVEDAPWHVVPADDKPNARLIVSQIVIDALDALELTPPPIDAARRRELKAIRAKLTK